MRKNASTQSERITTLKKGDRVAVLDSIGSFYWGSNGKGKYGFVLKSFLSFDHMWGELDVKYVKTICEAPIYKIMYTEMKSGTTVPEGTILNVYYFCDEWVYTDNGFVYGTDVVPCSEKPTVTPTQKPTATPTPIPTATPKPTSVNKCLETKADAYLYTSAKSSTKKYNVEKGTVLTATKYDNGRYYVSWTDMNLTGKGYVGWIPKSKVKAYTNSMNNKKALTLRSFTLRYGASSKSEAVVSVPFGASVTILPGTQKGAWIKIQYAPKATRRYEGYALISNLLPYKGAEISNSYLRVRQQPDITAKILERLLDGMGVYVLTPNPEGKYWVKVAYNVGNPATFKVGYIATYGPDPDNVPYIQYK